MMAITCAQNVITEEDAAMAFYDGEVRKVYKHAPQVESQRGPMLDARIPVHTAYTAD